MGVLYDNFDGIEKIFYLKKREKNKPFALFFHSRESVFNFFRKSKTLDIITREFLPGPLTIISSPKKNLHPLLLKENLASFRVPDNKMLLSLLKEIGKPLAVTSLNLSGERVICTKEESMKKLKSISIFGTLKTKLVYSTIIKVYSGNIEILREGVISSREFYRKL